jgi:hypothetical protein
MPLDGEAPYRRIGLAWRRTSGRKETFRRVTGVLRDVMADARAAPTSNAALVPFRARQR